jgi:hypothetical protein
MKRVIKIYVEGQGEVQFFRHFLYSQLGIKLNFETKGRQRAVGVFANQEITVQDYDGGKTNGGIDKAKIEQLLKEIQFDGQRGIESVIIIDADTAEHTKAKGSSLKGGFDNRKDFLNRHSEKAPFRFFIVPNGVDDGNLEKVKANCISAHGVPFFECIGRYIADIQSIPKDRMPPKLDNLSPSDWKKNHLAWYEFNMINDKRLKEDGNHYLEDRIWNLNSEFLTPIKRFFEDLFGLKPLDSAKP